MTDLLGIEDDDPDRVRSDRVALTALHPGRPAQRLSQLRSGYYRKLREEAATVEIERQMDPVLETWTKTKIGGTDAWCVLTSERPA